MITKEGVITIEEGKFFLNGFHFKGVNNFAEARQDLMSYIDSILTEENFVPINIVNVSDEAALVSGVWITDKPSHFTNTSSGKITYIGKQKEDK